MPLPVAASLIYHHLNRHIGNVAQDSAYDAALNSTALALSQVCDIYCFIEGKLQRLPGEELALGAFEERGDLYRTTSGRVYRSLWMRRIDVMDAMVILKKAHEAIDVAKKGAKQV